MKIKLRIKLFLYRFFSTSFGKVLLKLLTFGVKIKNFGGNINQKNYPFLIIITVDTESGYVARNERRIWQKENPKAFIGYYCGIRNLMKIFNRHNVKATFLVSTNCFSSKGKEYNQIKQELNAVIKEGHEIGLHLHPDSDLSIQKKISKKFEATSAFFYSYQEKLEIVKAAKELIKQHLGIRIAEKLPFFYPDYSRYRIRLC